MAGSCRAWQNEGLEVRLFHGGKGFGRRSRRLRPLPCPRDRVLVSGASTQTAHKHSFATQSVCRVVGDAIVLNPKRPVSLKIGPQIQIQICHPPSLPPSFCPSLRPSAHDSLPPSFPPSLPPSLTHWAKLDLLLAGLADHSGTFLAQERLLSGASHAGGAGGAVRRGGEVQGLELVATGLHGHPPWAGGAGGVAHGAAPGH